ncbi:MAG: TVP38/TMEM64 family protein [Candidatus Pacebacteria bacterium]|nr:TVP38/TMEM64 family protein [Candidatus Paceibacterota bacterium]
MLFRKYKIEIFVSTLLLTLFLIAGYFSQVYLDTFVQLLDGRMATGMILYVLGATIATIIAPLSFFPVLPVAVSLWGSFIAAVLSIIAWSLGAAIAFLLARRFGKPLVLRFVGEKKMSLFPQLIPQKRLFIAVIFLRIALPVDLLSYALGLLGIMRFWPYLAATIIGITPFALGFSYLAGMETWYQVGALIIGILFVLISLPYLRRQYKKMFQED